jgi:hypothetical protein
MGRGWDALRGHTAALPAVPQSLLSYASRSPACKQVSYLRGLFPDNNYQKVPMRNLDSELATAMSMLAVVSV